VWLSRLAFIFLLLVSGAWPWAWRSTGEPIIEVNPPRAVVEVTSGGRPVHARYRVRNRSFDAVELRVVAKSCSCLDVFVEQPRLKPGSTGVVVVGLQAPQVGETGGTFLVEGRGRNGSSTLQRFDVKVVVRPRGLVVVPTRVGAWMDGVLWSRRFDAVVAHVGTPKPLVVSGEGLLSSLLQEWRRLDDGSWTCSFDVRMDDDALRRVLRKGGFWVNSGDGRDEAVFIAVK